MNLCSKPGCSGTGVALLAYDYNDRRATLQDPGEGEVSPHLYVMCARCSESLRPPRGWTLEDTRVSPPLFLERALHRRRAEPEEATPAPESKQLFFGYSA